MKPEDIRQLVHFRPGTAADLEFLRTLQRETMRPHVERAVGRWDETLQAERFYASTDPATHTVVELAGAPVGCQWVRRHADALELVRLYVAPEAQGRGLGTFLVRKLLAEAAQEGLPTRLRVLRGNPARRLYARLGFVVTGEAKTHVVMEAAAARSPR